MNDIEKKCKDILKAEGINLSSSIDYEINGEVKTLNIGWIIEAYMKSSPQLNQVFLDALKLSLEAKGMGVDKFFEDMGQLLLLTHLSDKVKV